MYYKLPENLDKLSIFELGELLLEYENMANLIGRKIRERQDHKRIYEQSMELHAKAGNGIPEAGEIQTAIDAGSGG